jgi:chromosomal replication initiator protein
MPAVQIREDHCRSAADVWAAAARVRAWRAQLKPPIRRVLIRCIDEPVKLKVKRYKPVREAGMKPVAFIQQTVANHYDISLDEMLCHMRDPRWMVPRQVAMFITREISPMSFPEIGKYFKRDHCSVFKSIKKIESMCEQDETFKQTVETLISECKQ